MLFYFFIFLAAVDARWLLYRSKLALMTIL